MEKEYEEKVKNFVKEAEVISNFLRQQVNQKIITQKLYKDQIERFLVAFNEIKSHNGNKNFGE